MGRICYLFFFNDTATTEIYTLSLHDALPIYAHQRRAGVLHDRPHVGEVEVDEPRDRDQVGDALDALAQDVVGRSEEHTSELQSRQYLVCRLLLEKKKHKIVSSDITTINMICD